MSLPALAKTWQFNLNHRVPAAGTAQATAQAVMLYLKNSLIGFASNPWTVIGSSSSVAAGMDAVDRWVTTANLVWAQAGNVHSWIVLQQAGINAKFQVCLELVFFTTGQPGRMVLAVSPMAGFGVTNGGTNGGTTSRPTATDEIVLLNGTTGTATQGTWLDGSAAAANADYLVNAWQSSDGQVTRVVFRTPGSAFRGYAAFERPKNPVAQWVNPSMAIWMSDTTNVLAYSTLNDAVSYHGNKPGGGDMPLFCTTEGVNAGLGENVTTVNDLTGGYQLTPMGLLSTTAGARGRHGEVFDLWFGVTSLQDGDTYPANGTKQLIQMGHLAFPWNGSTPIMS